MEHPNMKSQEMNTNRCESGQPAVADEKKPRPQPDHKVNCPRCDSGNTKFCYYNNYSLSQPRYFCKACRRYWTKGGTLRNVPVGGGCRKNKRSSAKRAHHHHIVHGYVENVDQNKHENVHHVPLSNFASPLSYEDSGISGGGENLLSLAFARLQKECNNGEYLGFELDPKNSVFGQHQQVNNSLIDLSHLQPQRSNTNPNLGFLNNFFESQTPSNFNSNNLFKTGFEICGDQNHHQSHTQPLLATDQTLNLTTADGFSLMSGSVKQEMCNNNGGGLNENNRSSFWGLPWQMDNNNNNVGNGFESWNNSSGLASAQTWPNLINSALM